jgi:transposase-like protein
MEKELLRKLKAEAKNVEDLNWIFVELKKGLIEMMYQEEMKEQLEIERSENKEGRSNNRNGRYGKRVPSKESEIDLKVPSRQSRRIRAKNRVQRQKGYIWNRGENNRVIWEWDDKARYIQ